MAYRFRFSRVAAIDSIHLIGSLRWRMPAPVAGLRDTDRVVEKMTGKRTTVRRFPELGSYDVERIYAILDEALVCHVGFTDDAGETVVIPSIHARSGASLYLHGAPGSRMMKTLSTGASVCVTATLLDGIMLARTPTHSSYQYRSVVLFGRPTRVRDAKEKLEALRLITEHVTPGRWDDCRRPSKTEIDKTAVVRIRIEEASAKISTGQPEDDPDDHDLDIWAGVIPLSLVAGSPIPNPELPPGTEAPPYLTVSRHKS